MLSVSIKMIFRKKNPPLDSREALGFRGTRKKRSCFFCGTTEENNFDEFGKLQMLKVLSKDKNINNTRVTNHIYICVVPTCVKSRPFI